jgi:hypothetical protein
MVCPAPEAFIPHRVMWKYPNLNLPTAVMRFALETIFAASAFWKSGKQCRG